MGFATFARELAARKGIILLDVREPAEFGEGCIGSACNVPRGVLEFKVDPTYPACEKTLLDRQLENLVYCKTGGRSAFAAHTLKQLGYLNVTSLAGGIEAWKRAGFDVTPVSQILSGEQAIETSHPAGSWEHGSPLP